MWEAILEGMTEVGGALAFLLIFCLVVIFIGEIFR